MRFSKVYRSVCVCARRGEKIGNALNGSEAGKRDMAGETIRPVLAKVGQINSISVIARERGADGEEAIRIRR